MSEGLRNKLTTYLHEENLDLDEESYQELVEKSKKTLLLLLEKESLEFSEERYESFVKEHSILPYLKGLVGRIVTSGPEGTVYKYELRGRGQIIAEKIREEMIPEEYRKIMMNLQQKKEQYAILRWLPV